MRTAHMQLPAAGCPPGPLPASAASPLSLPGPHCPGAAGASRAHGPFPCVESTSALAGWLRGLSTRRPPKAHWAVPSGHGAEGVQEAPDWCLVSFSHIRVSSPLSPSPPVSLKINLKLFLKSTSSFLSSTLRLNSPTFSATSPLRRVSHTALRCWGTPLGGFGDTGMGNRKRTWAVSPSCHRAPAPPGFSR
ncbi:hypothetical protein HJG60_009448 [Phyllostomus discolor]|uniref:Uncharacterized protein n=1 Tax=Phyllostomus discolor TaxID=89673 RepID=A0A833YKV0_9CHIR|nr:hypothetical protein HJG60_009448 [Phyllostomus discolor]